MVNHHQTIIRENINSNPNPSRPWKSLSRPPAASSAAERCETHPEEEESPKDTRVQYRLRNHRPIHLWMRSIMMTKMWTPWNLCGQQWTLEQPLHAWQLRCATENGFDSHSNPFTNAIYQCKRTSSPCENGVCNPNVKLGPLKRQKNRGREGSGWRGGHTAEMDFLAPNFEPHPIWIKGSMPSRLRLWHPLASFEHFWAWRIPSEIDVAKPR